MPFTEDGGFYSGVNIAWLNRDYDHDLGINPFHPDWGTSFLSGLSRILSFCWQGCFLDQK